MDNVGSSAPVGAVGGRGQVYTYTLQWMVQLLQEIEWALPQLDQGGTPAMACTIAQKGKHHATTFHSS